MWKSVAAVALAAVLSGCASVRLIESDVTSYSQWPASRPVTTFSFERLPSQQAQPEVQARIEAAALPATSVLRVAVRKGVAVAYRLFSQTKITPAFCTPAKFTLSWNAP